MTRKEKDKSAKKKTEERSPKKREDPAMDEAEINRRLLQNALDQANAKAEQKLEERLKALLLVRDDLSPCFQRRSSIAWPSFCHDTLICLQILVGLLPC